MINVSGVFYLTIQEAKNLVYAAAAPILEELEHNGQPVAQGHHLTQRITEAFEAAALARKPPETLAVP